MAISSILRTFRTLHCYLVKVFLVVWYIFPRFGMLCEEKSGNTARNADRIYSNLVAWCRATQGDTKITFPVNKPLVICT
jgi:hypothetical protein